MTKIMLKFESSEHSLEPLFDTVVTVLRRFITSKMLLEPLHLTYNLITTKPMYNCYDKYGRNRREQGT